MLNSYSMTMPNNVPQHNPALAALPDVFLETDGRGTVTCYHGGGAGDRLIRPADLIGKPFRQCWPSAAAEKMHKNIRKALHNRRGHEFELCFDPQPGNTHEVRLFVIARNRMLVAIRPLDRSTEKPEPRLIDTLTGLATQDRFLIDLEGILAEARLRETRVGLLCLDLKQFGRVNETLGREIGDRVLQAVAQRIEGCLRREDGLSQFRADGSTARVDGDEFVLVVRELRSREELVSLATRVEKAFEEPISLEGLCLPTSPSIGIGCFPEDGNDAPTLFHNTRAALNTQSGDGFSGRPGFGVDLQRELRWAIEQSQLELHYLPRMELISGKVTGLEALLRWRHPFRGLLPGKEFIPLAETAGLIRNIGEQALVTACRFAASLDLDGRTVVSVNLSNREFSRHDLPQLVEAALEETGLDGERLQLEFTESGLLRNRAGEKTLRALKSLGVALVIDDFGTGHFSLRELQDLPIDGIKIDTSFVAGLGEDPGCAAMCAAMIAIGQELGLIVIAEGVQSEEQADFLVKQGCEMAQGFYYSRPLPAEDAAVFLTTMQHSEEALAPTD